MRPTNLRRLRPQRGAELIEFALVLPLLLVVIAGIVDFGFLFQRYVVVNNAAREGARVAILPNYTAANASARVTAYVREGVGDQTLPVNTTVNTVLNCVGTDSCREVTVQVQHRYLILGPIMGLIGSGSFDSVTLTARSTMRVESN